MCNPTPTPQTTTASVGKGQTSLTTTISSTGLSSAISDDECRTTTPHADSTHGDDALTPLTVTKYLLSLALLLFSIVVTVSLILSKSTKLSSDVSPWLALCVLCGAILWLGMMEGQQVSLVGLTGVVDHLVYRGIRILPLTRIRNWPSESEGTIWIDKSTGGSLRW
mmetsp:Transcript_1438/g.3111  ORF Transcript_1438/g.3111 Transcript_1438/m.3111 type:complete len:166 (+) Transcript_1438:171-668(+)